MFDILFGLMKGCPMLIDFAIYFIMYMLYLLAGGLLCYENRQFCCWRWHEIQVYRNPANCNGIEPCEQCSTFIKAPINFHGFT